MYKQNHSILAMTRDGLGQIPKQKFTKSDHHQITETRKNQKLHLRKSTEISEIFCRHLSFQLILQSYQKLRLQRSLVTVLLISKYNVKGYGVQDIEGHLFWETGLQAAKLLKERNSIFHLLVLNSSANFAWKVSIFWYMILEDRLFSLSPFALFYPFSWEQRLVVILFCIILFRMKLFIYSFTTKTHFSNSSSI